MARIIWLVAAAPLFWASPAPAAYTKISALPAAGALTGVEAFPCVQSAPTDRCTVTQAVTFTYSPLSGDCTATSGGAITCLKTNGVAFAALAFKVQASLAADVSGILPIGNGGTATASPPLVTGTNVSITGLWPGQTINATGVSSAASSAVLAANQLIFGGGAGAAPASIGSLGTTTSLLHGNATGAPSFGAISSVDVIAVLASPPPIGSTTPNTGAFSTLGVTGNFNVDAPNLVGDGVTNNNTALQAALTAAGSGGYLRIPCGSYKITAMMAVTVASGKRITVDGAGQECTRIAVSGAVDGLTFTLADETAGVDIRGLTITTDQAGTQNGITIVKTTANTLEGYATPQSVRAVSFYGSDYPNASNPTEYWGEGLTLNNVNNVAVDRMFFIGGGCLSSQCLGNGVKILGKGSGSYGVVFDINDSNFGLCDIGIVYGDWIQGVAVSSTNVTGCQYGILTAQAPTGSLDQLAVVNSQFNNTQVNIDANTGASGHIYHVQIANNLFFTLGGNTAISLKNAFNYSIVGNVFEGGAPGIGIDLVTNDINGIVSGNVATGLATGLKVDASGTFAKTIVSGNRFNNNTTDISVGAGVTGIIIDDDTPRSIVNLFPCTAGLVGSKTFVSDVVANAAPAYHVAVVGGGATTVNSPAYCDGAGWKYN